MLEIFQEINSWIWNILGLVVGIPILISMVSAILIGFVGLIVSTFTYKD